MPSYFAALAIATAALVGCAPSATGTPGTSGSATPTSSAAAPSTGGPVGSAAPAIELPRDAELTPGRYTRAAFTPRITFEVGAGWTAVQALEGFFDIQQDAGSADVIALHFARPDGFYGANGTLVEPASAEAAAAAIAANPALTILDSSASRMSGLEGFVVEVENPATAASPAAVLHVPSGALSIDPARRLWVAVFDTPAGIVAILVGGSVERWDEALAAAEPVLETVTIGE